MTVAYTGTNIDTTASGDTSYCAGRFFVSLTKAF